MGAGDRFFAGRLTLVRAANRPQTPMVGSAGRGLLVVAFVQLGRWQLGVAEDKAPGEQLEAAKKVGVVELSTVLQPHSPFLASCPGDRFAPRGRMPRTSRSSSPTAGLTGRPAGVVTALHTDASPTLPVLARLRTSPDAVPAPPAGP